MTIKGLYNLWKEGSQPPSKNQYISKDIHYPKLKFMNYDKLFHSKESINNISNTKHKKTTQGNSSVFVVADSDWIFDPFSLQKQIVGEEIITRPLNDNLNFFLNIIEYASGNDSLMNIRSKGNTQRSFVRVADLFKEVEDQIRIKELKISQEVSKLELKLINLTPKHNELNYKQLSQELKIELNKKLH